MAGLESNIDRVHHNVRSRNTYICDTDKKRSCVKKNMPVYLDDRL
jgi:hypothetical protein